jgi:hypothetical protein
MNNKYVLAAICATAFSGINLLADPTLSKTIFNGIANQEIREYCIKNLNTSATCQKLERVLIAGSEVIGVLLDKIEEEINANKVDISEKISEQNLNKELENIAQ